MLFKSKVILALAFLSSFAAVGSYPESRTTVVTNAAGEVVLSDSLKSKLTLWLDAMTNVVVDADLGGVVQWLDVRETPVEGLADLTNRETNADFDYPRAKLHRTAEGSVFDATPPLFTTFSGIGGKKAIDFGEYQIDDRWLYFTKGAGTEPTKINTTSFIGVYAFHTSAGFILDGVTNLLAEGGIPCYHKSFASERYSPISVSLEQSNKNAFLSGGVWLNGCRVNPVTQYFPLNEQFCLFSSVGPAIFENILGRSENPFASVMFNNSNFRKDSGSGMSSYNRQGGGIVAELLCFDSVLTDVERRQVEAYLAAKWFGTTVYGEVDVAEGTSLSVGEGETGTVYASDFSGNGTVVKSGTGRLLVGYSEGLSDTSYAVQDGSVEFGQKLDARIVSPVAGTSLSVSYSNLTATSGASSRFGVTSDGGDAVLFHATDLGTMPIDISGAKVTIVPPLAGSVGSVYYPERNLLVNGSFESPVLPPTSNNLVFAADQSNGWFWDGDSSVAYRPAYIVRYGGPFRANNVDKIDGNQMLALSINDKITTDEMRVSQYFDAPVTGLYTVNLWMTRRESRKETEGQLKMQLLLDDEVFCTVVNQGDCGYNTGLADRTRDDFRPVCVDLPPLSAGRHKFSIQTPKENLTTDRSLIVDDVRLTLSTPGDFVKVINPGFESFPSLISEQYYLGFINGMYAQVNQVEGWTFGTSYSDGATPSAGITQNSVWWAWCTSLAGYEAADYRKAYLRNSYAATTVDFPRDGNVRMSFRYSSRANYDFGLGDNRDFRHHTLSMYIDDNIVGSEFYTCTQKQYLHTEYTNVVAGTRTVKIASVSSNTGDNSSVIDDLRIEYIAGRLKNGESLDISITVPSNGFYSLSVPLCGIEPNFGQYGYQNTQSCNWLYFPAKTMISLDGTRLAEVSVEKQEWSIPTFRLPYLTAGEHIVSIDGITIGSGSDAVRNVGTCELTPLPIGGMISTVKDVNMSLADGAKLDLQYNGTLKVIGSLRVNGAIVSGLVSAETYPQWVEGPGAFMVHPCGSLLTIK